jgi:4-diphosphocytidyl-2-C-methyl-D-erythritol kinase
VTGWQTREAPAKVNLSLVVGPVRPDGKHEVATLMERLSLADTIALRRSPATVVSGFDDDTLVRAALEGVARAAGADARFEARIEKRIPVAAGLGGGSSDAAAALRLANELLGEPLDASTLHDLAASLGADVPFFLQDGPQLGTGDGTTLTPVELPRDYAVLLAMPAGAVKMSTTDVSAAFDAQRGDLGYDERRAALVAGLPEIRAPEDLAHLPRNDLASSPLADELEAAGALRADVSGAGPAVYALFANERGASHAAGRLGARARTWIARPG